MVAVDQEIKRLSEQLAPQFHPCVYKDDTKVDD